MKTNTTAPRRKLQKLLIISCSAAKRGGPPAKMPAIERYDGVFFKVLRKAWREPDQRDSVVLLIISAKYGLITPETRIANYDTKINSRQAAKLGPKIRQGIKLAVRRNKPSKILVNLGKSYESIIRELPELQDAVWAEGPIGKRAATLKSWLVNDNQAILHYVSNL